MTTGARRADTDEVEQVDRPVPLNLIHRRGPRAAARGHVPRAATWGLAAGLIAVTVWWCRRRTAALCAAAALAGVAVLADRAGARRRWRRRDARIDESVVESFPASDPPSMRR